MEKQQQRRIVTACLLLILLLASLSLRLVFIQVLQSEALAARARAHYEHEEILEAPRGRIYDRNGELLAGSQTVYSLVVDCNHLQDPGLASIGLARKEQSNLHQLRNRYLPGELQSHYISYVVETLAGEIRIQPPELDRLLRSKKTGEIMLARNIEEDIRRKLEKLIQDSAIGGVYFQKSQRRSYPSPLSLTHVIGYMGADQDGKEGIEKVFDQALRGTSGYRICERDRRRREIHAYRKENIEPIPGQDVYLTIDMALQTEVEIQIDKLMTMYRPEKISTIWLRPSTGEILAMANRPHFDLETRKGSLRNIAVTDLYQPGSTFKIVAFGAAFDRDLITPSTLIDCHAGHYDAEGFIMKDHSPHGTLTAEMVLALSSNIGSYLVAKPLGEQTFHYYMSQFGFGGKSGISLTAENSGAIFPVNQWTKTSFSSKTIGYEVMVTPLQMAAGCSVVANGGIYRSPFVISKMVASDGTATESPRSHQRRVISEKAAQDLRSCMVTALRIGTGKRAVIPGYTVAGKTGTARKHVENQGYAEGRYVVSFVGFLPADRPELLGLIVIDDPQSKDLDLYGGTIAAPAFKSIAQEAVKILGIKPDQPQELTTVQGESTVAVICD